MRQRISDIFQRSGDAHIGQTLVRLATLAQAAHHLRNAELSAQRGSLDLSLSACRIENGAPLDSLAVVAPTRMEALDGSGRIHTEVDR